MKFTGEVIAQGFKVLKLFSWKEKCIVNILTDVRFIETVNLIFRDELKICLVQVILLVNNGYPNFFLY